LAERCGSCDSLPSLSLCDPFPFFEESFFKDSLFEESFFEESFFEESIEELSSFPPNEVKVWPSFGNAGELP